MGIATFNRWRKRPAKDAAPAEPNPEPKPEPAPVAAEKSDKGKKK